MKPERNRVLMLLENCSYPRDTRVRHEAEVLVQNGYRVSVISPDYGEHLAHHDTLNDVQVYRFPPPPPAHGAFGYIWEYLYSSACIFSLSLWVFFREGIDIVHAHNPPDLFFLFAPVVKMLGIAFIYDHHDLAPELFDARFNGRGNKLIRKLLVVCEQLTYKVSTHVIVTNESYRQIALKHGHVPPEHLAIVRNGPDDILPLLPKNSAENLLVYVGSMGFHDGVEYLLRAIDYLTHTLGFQDFRCILLGDGDAFESLRQLAAGLNILDWVEFKGWLSSDDVKTYLSMADVCAAPEPHNPYNNASTMIKVMEYMAAGKAIVAFDLAEHRRTAGQAALYARPNDIQDYARQILVLVENPKLRTEMGKRGQERIANDLAWHFQADVLLSVYDSLWEVTQHHPIRV